MKILITGASGYFGKLLTHKLRTLRSGKYEVIGVDIDTPKDEPHAERIKYLIGDTRKKRIGDIFKTEGKIDCVIHLAWQSSTEGQKSDELMMTNVYGTFHMLELARNHDVEKFIFPSSTIVYGARNDNPALIRENHPLLGNRDLANIRDRIEADMICQTFAQGCLTTPKVVMLRFSPIWRRGGNGILNRYMAKPYVPTLLGFDPMYQITFEHEVLEALTLAVRNDDACGIFNIPGKVFMPLSGVIKHLGKTPMPVPEFVMHSQMRSLWSEGLTFDPSYIKYPFTVDGTLAREVLGYKPEKLKKAEAV